MPWVGEMRFSSEQWIGFGEIWVMPPVARLVCPTSLSIQTFGPGGRHIGRALVQTLVEISALAFLVTGQGSCPWVERRVLPIYSPLFLCPECPASYLGN